MMQLFSNRRQQFTDNIKNEMKRFRGGGGGGGGGWSEGDG